MQISFCTESFIVPVFSSVLLPLRGWWKCLTVGLTPCGLSRTQSRCHNLARSAFAGYGKEAVWITLWHKSVWQFHRRQTLLKCHSLPATHLCHQRQGCFSNLYSCRKTQIRIHDLPATLYITHIWVINDQVSAAGHDWHWWTFGDLSQEFVLSHAGVLWVKRWISVFCCIILCDTLYKPGN